MRGRKRNPVNHVNPVRKHPPISIYARLNSPYQLLQNLERDTTELEAKIKADPDFSDKHKQEFIAGLIDPIKDDNQRARAVDAYIMNGVPLPDFKD